MNARGMNLGLPSSAMAAEAAGTGGPDTGADITALSPLFCARLESLLRPLPEGVLAAVACRHPRIGTHVVANGSAADHLRAVVLRGLDQAAGSDTGHSGDDGPSLDTIDVGEGARLSVGVDFASEHDAGTRRDTWRALIAQWALQALRLDAAMVRIESLEKSKRLQQALYGISDLAGSGLEMRRMLAEIHRIVGGLMSAENLYIVLYDTERETLRYLYFADCRDDFDPDPRTEYSIHHLDHTMTAALLRHGQPLIGPPMAILGELGIEVDASAGGPMSEDWLGVCLRRDDRVCGAIVVQHYEQPESYDDEDRALLDYVGQHILVALDRKSERERLEARVEERTRELQQTNRELQAEVLERQRAEKLQQALYRITELSVVEQSLDRFYAGLHETIGELLYARNFYIALLTQDGHYLQFPYAVDERDTRTDRSRPRARGLTEYVIDTGRPLLAHRGLIQDLEARGLVRSFGPLAHCWLGVPLVRDGAVEGVIGVQSYTPEVDFSERDQELLTFVAHHVDAALARKRAQERLVAAHTDLERRVDARTRELADTNRELLAQVNERLRAEQRLRHQARHDDLTSLPNRTHLQERLDDAIARAAEQTRRAGAGAGLRHIARPTASADGMQTPAGPGFAVLFLDIDRFKLINDSVGHVAGDELLVETSRRLSLVVGPDDAVARLGGDEFAVIAEGVTDPAEAERYAARILAAMEQPLWIHGRELFPSASIGIAMWHPRYRKSEELLRDADAAMYRAKREGRNRSVVFDEAMRAEAMRLLDLEADLRRAIIHDDFLPFFQPLVRLADGRQVGSEALVRWRHEHRGLLTPSDFIGVGEDSTLIEQIDWLMYGHVIAAMGELPGDHVSINVSPRHFLSDNFAERILRMLDESRQDPRRLRIEITEVALIEDADRALQVLRQLQRHGVYAVLDDFGTGFSALSYLHRFPIQGLKIDRSFVTGLEGPTATESLALVRAILAMALTLGIDTTAEGIETEAQRGLLVEMGCQFGQGYLLGRPAPLTRGPAAAHPDTPARA